MDPSNRYTATQALRSDWIKDVDDNALLVRDLSGRRSTMNSSLSCLLKSVNNWKSYSTVSDVSFDGERTSI